MRLSFLILLSFLICELHAQNYTRDCGLRFSDNFSGSYRQFFDEQEALEVMLTAGKRGLSLSVLKEYTQPAFGKFSENIQFVYGFGAHAGFRYDDRYRVLNRTYDLNENRFMPLFGIDGYLAFEYMIRKFPVIIGIDFKPYFEYSNIQIFSVNLSGFGLSMKYRF
jgi:hypothetical protein